MGRPPKKKRTPGSPPLGRSPKEGVRLNKYLANAGVASRRKCDELIKQGLVKVNGAVITEMGHRIKSSDKVTFKGDAVKPANYVYVLLNKPKDFITTTDDEKNRKTVMDLVRRATDERIYPVGRLDRNTTGLLLLTNDGELAQKLSHPSFEIDKLYHVGLNKPLSLEDFQAVKKGVKLEDGEVPVDELAYANPNDPREVGVKLHVGRNRIVRRLFEHLGYEVTKLDRVMYAGLTKKDLPRGKWRFLKKQEVIFLKHYR